MKTIKIIFTTLLLLLSVASVYAQGRKISGKILSPLNKPIEGAIISAVGSKDAKTGVDGTFKMELRIRLKFQCGQLVIIRKLAW